MFYFEVNLNSKVRKVRLPNSPNITLETLDLLHAWPLTMNVVASVVYSWYNPFGLICPLILKYKLLLCQTIRSDAKWKDVLSEPLQVNLKSDLQEAVMIGRLFFPRSVKPAGTVGSPTLIGYADGSKAAFGAVLYHRWVLGNFDPNHAILDMVTILLTLKSAIKARVFPSRSKEGKISSLRGHPLASIKLSSSPLSVLASRFRANNPKAESWSISILSWRSSPRPTTSAVLAPSLLTTLILTPGVGAVLVTTLVPVG